MVEKPTPDRRSFLKAIGAGTLFGGLSGVASATPGRQPGPKTEEILVGVSASAADMEGAVAQAVPANAAIVHRNHTLSHVAVKFPSQAADRAKENFIDAVTRKDHIKYAEPNKTYGAFYEPSDPRFGDQYAPKQVESDGAWDTTLGDSGVDDRGRRYGGHNTTIPTSRRTTRLTPAGTSPTTTRTRIPTPRARSTTAPTSRAVRPP